MFHIVVELEVILPSVPESNLVPRLSPRPDESKSGGESLGTRLARKEAATR